MPELSGLDVYEGQGDINWAAVPNLTFVCAKASQWREDRKFRRNWEGMRARQFPVRGAYHFVTTEPAAVQAQRFRSIVGELLPSEVPALDIEPAGSIPVLGQSFLVDVRNAVEDAFGRQALIYIGFSYPGARAIVDGRPWWFPSYGISEAGMRRQAAQAGIEPWIWQWGGGGEGADVPGVTPGLRDDSNQVLRPAELRAWASTFTTTEEDDMFEQSDRDAIGDIQKWIKDNIPTLRAESADTNRWVKVRNATDPAEIEKAVREALVDFDVEIVVKPRA
jgi:hypothetical protein